MTKKVLFAWSGGKDSALALYKLMQKSDYQIVSLLTTLTEGYKRISMHGVPETLLDSQAESIDLPLEKMFIPKNCTNKIYESKMKAVLKKYQKQGVTAVVFGDIFLEDLKKYREENLAKIGLTGIFPLWKITTKKLSREFIKLGFKSIITCVDTKLLNKKFTGQEYNEKFLAYLPKTVDPCGENGEFHSFVYDGPIFKNKVNFKKGKTVLRDRRFSFYDLIIK